MARVYVYLTASYYATDAIADGHLCLGSQLSLSELVPYQQLLTATAAARAVFLATPAGFGAETCALLNRTLRENLIALEAERSSWTVPFAGWDREFFHLQGRSSCAVFLMQFVSLLCDGAALPADFLELARALLAAVQRGDDLCDWRIDSRRGTFTPFLRSCASPEWLAKASFEEIEELILLGGGMERELGQLSSELQRLRQAFSLHTRGQALSTLCEQQLQRVQHEFHAFRMAKEDVR